MTADSITYLQAIVLGAVQGLTEFLPVSSSGHLALAQSFFGVKTSNLFSFDILLHVATALVAIRYFWPEIKSLLGVNRVVIGNIIVATIPAGVLGLAFRSLYENISESPVLVCLGLFTTAFFLWQAERVQTIRCSIRTLGLVNALAIGLAQALAITPGISRSGLTVCAGITCGMPREDAFRFSFLMMIPIVLAAALVDCLKHRHEMAGLFTGPLFAGMISAMIFGWIALRILEKLLNGRKLRVFAVYCFAVGSLGMLWRLFGA